MATWNPAGWKFLGSQAQRQPDGRFKHVTKFGKSYSPPRYDIGTRLQVFEERVITYYLPADRPERDARAPGGSLYHSHTDWLAIREIHLSGLDPIEFDGRELPTISEEAARV